MARVFVVLSFLCVSLRLFGLSLPSEWSFGVTDSADPLMRSLSVLNDEAAPLSLGFVSSCDCLTVEPAVLTLQPGQGAVVTFILDPRAYSGNVRVTVLVLIEGHDSRRILVHGTVVSAGATARVPSYGRPCELCPEQPVVVRYYFSADCASCGRFIDEEIPRLAESVGTEILVNRRDVGFPEVLRELDAILSARGLVLAALPVAVVGEIALQGESAIRQRLGPEIQRLLGMPGRRGE